MKSGWVGLVFGVCRTPKKKKGGGGTYEGIFVTPLPGNRRVTRAPEQAVSPLRVGSVRSGAIRSVHSGAIGLVHSRAMDHGWNHLQLLDFLQEPSERRSSD